MGSSLFPQKQVCKAVVEDSLKKGEQSPEGRSWLLQELCCQQLLIHFCLSCLGGLSHNNIRSVGSRKGRSPAPSRRGEGMTPHKVALLPALALGRKHQGSRAQEQAAEDTVFLRWWQILEKGQKLDQEVGTYAKQAQG